MTSRPRSAAGPAPRFLVGGRELRAAIFDLDGVITDTAVLHRHAWTAVLDEFLAGERPTQPGLSEQDYLTYIDGKTRIDGIRSFLAARSIGVDESTRACADPGLVATLAAQKDLVFRSLLNQEGPHPITPSVELIRRLHRACIPVAVVSGSRNAAAVLSGSGVSDAVTALVDGRDAARLDLPGKPDPALFLEAARRLDVNPSDTAVVEDAASGVQAARHGGFGLVIGLATAERAAALFASGADLVVPDVDAVNWSVTPGRPRDQTSTG